MYKYVSFYECFDKFFIITTLQKGFKWVFFANKKQVFFSVYVYGEECQKTLELGKELKRFKRVMVNVI